jgi:hypothetical protein
VAETNKHPLKIQWKEPEQSQRTVIPLRDFVQPKKIPCGDKEASAARAIPSVRLTTTINGNMLHHELATEPVPKPHTAHRSAPATTRSLVGAVLYKTPADRCGCRYHGCAPKYAKVRARERHVPVLHPMIRGISAQGVYCRSVRTSCHGPASHPYRHSDRIDPRVQHVAAAIRCRGSYGRITRTATKIKHVYPVYGRQASDISRTKKHFAQDCRCSTTPLAQNKDISK